SDAPNVLYKDLVTDALHSLEKRKAAVALLDSREDWQRYQATARAKLLEVIGPFPPKTPLKARVTGVVKKAGFRVEKVVYESQPGLFVTAALFVPEPLRGRAPAILYCSGHVEESFRSRAYQHVVLNLVKRGFIVLAFDPIGQGERLQYFNTETGRTDFGTALGHSRGGAPGFLLNASIARLMTWDGIRSIDYLVSREEVDPRRLGITGRSGGGTQS